MSSQGQLVVPLDQGRVVGTQLQDKTLPIHVGGFLGIPYALPPIGDRRFCAPVKVAPNLDSTIDASKCGHAAPGQDLSFLNVPPVMFREDCLTVNVYRASSTHASRLPVLMYIHGGGFNMGWGNMYNTASMIAHIEDPFIGVSFNHHLGALGFLPSHLAAKEGVLNLGFHD